MNFYSTRLFARETRYSFEYRKDLDGLRAIAVLMVLVFHFDLLGSKGAGFLGVDVFFVISGYLITSIIGRQIARGSFSLPQFYLNRVRRLAPALFATLFLVFLAGEMLLFPADFTSLVKEVAAAQLYVSNFYYWRTINYFGLSANSAYLLHTWSLAVEEQFYLLYPIGLALAYRFAMKRVFALVLGALAISFLLNLYFVASKPEATFYLLPTRAWELLAGACIALIDQRMRFARLTNLFGIVGLLLLAASFALLDRTYRFPGVAAIVPTAGAALAILAGADGKGVTQQILTNGVLRYVGRISYPLYLVHWPIIVFCEQLFGERYTAPWRVAMFAVSIGLASAIYHLVERPIRDGKFAARSVVLISCYAAGLSLSLLASVAVIGLKGMPGRFAPQVAVLAAYSGDRPPEMPECEHKGSFDPSKICTIGTPGVAPTWLIYGDSHAWAAREALEAWLASTGRSALFAFKHSCPPLRGVHLYHDRGECFSFNEGIFALLKRSPAIENVFLVSIWRQPLDALTASDDIPPSPERSIRLFQEQFRASLSEIVAMGKRAYVWEPLPGANADVPQAMARALAGYPSTSLEVNENTYRDTFAYFFKALVEEKAMISGTFSPSKILCGSGICAVSLDGIPLYFDNNHLAASSASFWANQLKVNLGRDD